MHKRVLPIVALIVFAFSFSAISQQSLRVGATVPQITGRASNGVEYSMAGLKGKVVVLTFWSVYCQICRVELPHLDQMVGQFKPEEVEFLAMSPESEDLVASFTREHPFRFRVVANSFGPLLQYADRDADGRVQMQYPAFYVVGADGRLTYRGSGYGKTHDLSTAIRKAVSSTR